MINQQRGRIVRLSYHPVYHPAFRLALCAALLWLTGSVAVGRTEAQALFQAAATPNCRLSVAAPLGVANYLSELQLLRAGAYLDWGTTRTPGVPAKIDYIYVLRVRSDVYASVKAGLPALLAANPGQTWLVGNEPDTYYENQDGVLPETYADRFFELATIIRAQDPTAKTGFATIVQPTPLRLRYLTRAYDRLVARAGSAAAASELIDLWSIHSFILNEQPGQWGTGIPPGFENDYSDAQVITNFHDTHSVSLFQQRVRNLRSWMAQRGQRDKPLWITEYGSLFPEWYPGFNDQITIDFLTQTFNWMRNAADSQTGMSGDANRLVQRWFWYSLNGVRTGGTSFGGTLFDPALNRQITPIGTAYRNYSEGWSALPDLAFAGWKINRQESSGGIATYTLRIEVINRGSAHTFDGFSATLVKKPGVQDLTVAQGTLPRLDGCGSRRWITLSWDDSDNEPYPLSLSISPLNSADEKPTDNQALIIANALNLYLPFVSR